MATTTIQLQILCGTCSTWTSLGLRWCCTSSICAAVVLSCLRVYSWGSLRPHMYRHAAEGGLSTCSCAKSTFRGFNQHFLDPQRGLTERLRHEIRRQILSENFRNISRANFQQIMRYWYYRAQIQVKSISTRFQYLKKLLGKRVSIESKRERERDYVIPAASSPDEMKKVFTSPVIMR